MPLTDISKNEMNKFNNLEEPFFKKTGFNTEQNQTLTILRDTLLPKLMNGEIDVDKVEV